MSWESLSGPGAGDAEGHPAGPGRYTRALHRAGWDPGPGLSEREALLDALLKEAAQAFDRLQERHAQDAHHIEGLLIGDEDSPVPGQLADLAGSTRRIAQLLRAQAREAAILLVALRRGAGAADELAAVSETLRAAYGAPPDGGAVV